MKVLHLINNLGSGGAEKLLEDLVPLMDKTKNIESNILILTDKNNVFYDTLINKGVKVDVIKYRSMYDPRNIFKIKNYISDGDYDIVHSHTFPTQMWVALSRFFLRNKEVKFVTTEHSTHNRRREKCYFRPLDKLIYSQYDLIISITEKTKVNLMSWIDTKGKKMDKYVVVENGVDIEKIKEALPYSKSELIEGISKNTKLVCMVGRFSEAKDQPTLLRAISELSEDIQLVLVGEGPLMSDNMELADELGISDRVHFFGFRQDIPRILKTVDIVVLSSHWEGFGLAAVEGMAAGKPVIVSDVEGLNSVVDDSGLKYKSNDFHELSKKIKKILSSSDIYCSKVKYSNIRCEDFNIRRNIEELIKIYQEEKI